MSGMTIRVDLNEEEVQMGNDEIGFGKFSGSSRSIAWARKFHEWLEEQGIEVDFEEAD